METQKTVSDFMDFLDDERKRPMTKNYYLGFCREFLEFCRAGGKVINEESANEWLVYLGRTHKESSLHTKYFFAKTFLRWYLKRDDIKINFKLKKIYIEKPPSFTISNIDEMLYAAQSDKKMHINKNYTLLRAFVATLARRNELMQVTKAMMKKTIIEVDKQPREIYIVNFVTEISKSEPREIVIDKTTWNLMMSQETDEEGHIFPFSLRYAEYIMKKYRPAGVKGGCHAIRHGVAKFISSRIQFESDKDILRYYLGHKLPERDITDRYTFLEYPQLQEWYMKFNPLMIKY
jgi:hypothetical protein